MTPQVLGLEAVQAKLLLGVPASVRARLLQTVTALTLELERHVKADYLTGQTLKVRTGRLRSSIHSEILDTPTSITGLVGTAVDYGRAWELGFQVPARTILPVKKKALFWPGAAHPVAQVNQPARTQAARPFLRPALDDMRQSIAKRIGAALSLGGLGGP
jgi:hypothetical protein